MDQLTWKFPMITLSDQDKFIIECIIEHIVSNPTKEQTNKKLMTAFIEHLMNMTYPPRTPQAVVSLCKLTKTATFPFEDRLTHERNFLCVKCRTFHSQQQVQAIKEYLDENASQSPRNLNKKNGDG